VVMSLPVSRYAPICAALVLLGAQRAAAVRIEFKTIYNEIRIPDSEVCFFPGDASNQLKSYFQSNDVRCVPADKVLDVPRGAWHFFARSSDGFTSAWPGFVLLREDLDAYKGIQVDLVPAAKLNVSAIKRILQPKQHAVIYFPGTDADHLPFLFPVRGDEDTLLVPAGRKCVPMIAEQSRPVWIGAPLQLAPGEMIEADIAPLAPLTLVAWVQFDRKALRRWGGPLDVPPPPAIDLMTPYGKRFAPIVPVHHFGEPDLVLIPVPRDAHGPAELVVAGDHWSTYQRSLSLPNSAGVVTLDAPIPMTLLGAVSISWDLNGQAFAASSCAPAESSHPRLELLICSVNPSTSSSDGLPQYCRVVREVDASDRSVIELWDIEPGDYWVRFTPAGGVTPWYEQIVVESGAKVARRLVPHYNTITGRVTRANRAVSSVVTFVGGFGVSDATTGFYRAYLRRDPRTNSVSVRPCDGTSSFFDKPDHSLQAGDVYDIELPANAVQIRAIDSTTENPVVSADCQVRAEFTRDSVSRFAAKKTDDAGRTDLALSGRVLERAKKTKPALCCEHPEFATTCMDLPEDLETPTTVRMERKNARHGKLSVSPVDGGRLYWIADGRGVTEQVDVNRDGTFVFSRNHGEDEYLVFVSRNLPLYAIPAPHASDDGLEVALPSASTRNVRVHAAPGSHERLPIAVAIGNRVVPQEAFSFHQAMRGHQTDLQPGEALQLTDLCATEPIRVIAGYTESQQPASYPPGTDFFLLPQHRITFRYADVGLASDISF
jgi:hypothetical protein